MSSDPSIPRQPILVANEFGSALVSFDDHANDTRLRIEDPRTGRAIMLDPFQLQCLAYLTDADIREFMRPAFQEARAEGPGPGGENG